MEREERRPAHGGDVGRAVLVTDDPRRAATALDGAGVAEVRVVDLEDLKAAVADDPIVIDLNDPARTDEVVVTLHELVAGQVPVVVRSGSGQQAASLLAAGATEVLHPGMAEGEQRARIRSQLRAHAERRSLDDRLARLEALAGEDPLTGLANRRRLDQLAELLSANARRRDEPLGVLIVDVDHLKMVNDRFGHDLGDQALRQVAGSMQRSLRATDVLGRPDEEVLGRWAGDEFLVLMTPGEPEAMEALAKRLLGAVRAAPLVVPGGAITLTVTIGAAGGAPDVHTLLAAADRALYRAKAQSRDAVCVAGPAASATGAAQRRDRRTR